MPIHKSSTKPEWLEFEIRPGLALKAFDCGDEALNSYLKRWARKHQKQGYASTYVLAPADRPDTVAGFYSLAAAHVLHNDLPEELARQLPRFPMPAIRLTRMAVHNEFKGLGLGTMMVARAVRRVEIARENIGVRALLVDPKLDAAGFYKSLGFIPLENDAMFLPVGWYA